MRQLITGTFLTFATSCYQLWHRPLQPAVKANLPPQQLQTLAPVFPVSQVIRVDPQLSQPGALRHYRAISRKRATRTLPIFQASLEARVGLPWPLPRLHRPSS